MPGEAYFVKKHPDAIPPVFKSRLAACADISLYEHLTLRPREYLIVPTGLIVVPPSGYHFHVYLRSSAPVKYPGLILCNSVGIIDSDYIGPDDELKLILLNQSTNATIQIPAKTRVAQMRLVKNIKPSIFKELTYEQVQARQSRGGFGSTGQ